MVRAFTGRGLLTAVVLAFFGWVSTAGAADIILYRYPYSGFYGIAAANQSIKYWLNDSGAESLYRSNAADTWMPTGIHDAVDAWNHSRPWITYMQQAWECCAGPYWPHPYWFDHTTQQEGGTIIYWGHLGVDCAAQPPENREHCWSRTKVREDDPFPLTAYPSFTGSVVHELGHGLGSLKDVLYTDCSTVMSACWPYKNAPTIGDEIAMHEVYGIPDSVAAAWSGGTPMVCWYDRSRYEYGFMVMEWVFNPWYQVWVQPGTYYPPASPSSGNMVCFEDTTQRPPGSYLFAVFSRNTYPTNPPISADQFGAFAGFTH